jgi:hypothetical protein
MYFPLVLREARLRSCREPVSLLSLVPSAGRPVPRSGDWMEPMLVEKAAIRGAGRPVHVCITHVSTHGLGLLLFPSLGSGPADFCLREDARNLDFALAKTWHLVVTWGVKVSIPSYTTGRWSATLPATSLPDRNTPLPAR